MAACASPSGFVCRIEVGGKGERRESLGETATSRRKRTRDRRGCAREITGRLRHAPRR